MPYKVTISTAAYKHRRCSVKNWEPGTVNDFMEALDGWKITEPNLQNLEWRVLMFEGRMPHIYEGDPQWEDYKRWKNQPCNRIHYRDKLCELDRTEEVCPPGWKQGTGIRFDAVKQALREDGYIKIPFSVVYDARQYDKHMNGCFMEIKKVK